MRFPYQRYEVTPSATFPDGILYRPELSIRVTGETGSAFLFALVDTGADETLLPRSVGDLVGATRDPRHTWSVAGFGGHEVTVVLAEVEMEIASRRRSHRWRAKLGLVDFPSPENEMAVLGHVGFFEHFAVQFDSRQRTFTIKLHR